MVPHYPGQCSRTLQLIDNIGHGHDQSHGIASAVSMLKKLVENFLRSLLNTVGQLPHTVIRTVRKTEVRGEGTCTPLSVRQLYFSLSK